MKASPAFHRTFQFLGVLYALMAVAFFFLPDRLIYLANFAPRVLHIFEAIPEPTDNLWNILAAALCATLAALSFLTAESPKIRGYALAHILSRTVSVSGFVYYFLNVKPYFAYLAGAGADGLILVLVAWRTAMPGRPELPAAPTVTAPTKSEEKDFNSTPSGPSV